MGAGKALAVQMTVNNSAILKTALQSLLRCRTGEMCHDMPV
jgi:hypothetical protein